MVQRETTRRYVTDITDQEWMIIAPLVAQTSGPGRKRKVNIREVVNAIFYLTYTGCQWRMLPKEFPDYRHVNYYYVNWVRSGIWDRLVTSVRGVNQQRERVLSATRRA
jgi:putative transposase